MKFEKIISIKEAMEIKSSMKNAGEFSKENRGEAPITYTDAVKVSNDKAATINKEMKEKQKEVDAVVKDNERDAHKKLPKSQGLKKLKLSEATAVADVETDTDFDFSDEREDPYETFEDYDMFVFIMNLFTRDLKDHQRPLKPLGRTHKHFEYANKGEEIGDNSQTGVTREGDIVLKSDNVKDFDDVIAICDKYKFDYKGPNQSKNSKDYAYNMTIIVPKTKGGYPLNVEDYFESIDIDPKTVLPKWYFNIKKKYNKRYGIEEDYIYNENETLAEQAEAIADYLSEFLNTAANTEDIYEYLNEDELKEIGDMMDNFYWLANHYGKVNEAATKNLFEAEGEVTGAQVKQLAGTVSDGVNNLSSNKEKAAALGQLVDNVSEDDCQGLIDMIKDLVGELKLNAEARKYAKEQGIEADNLETIGDLIDFGLKVFDNKKVGNGIKIIIKIVFTALFVFGLLNGPMDGFIIEIVSAIVLLIPGDMILKVLYALPWLALKGGQKLVRGAQAKKKEKQAKLTEADIIKSTDDLKSYEPWEGAISTLNVIKDAGKLEALEYMLKEMYPNGITVDKLNDLLWFESDWVYDMLNIQNPDEEVEEGLLPKLPGLPGLGG